MGPLPKRKTRKEDADMNLNRVTLTGNLTADPDLRPLPSGTKVCELRIASAGRRKNQSGEWQDKPNYFNVKVRGAHGESTERFLSKGVTARLSSPLATGGSLSCASSVSDRKR
jgi:single-strand DNA-binding protein